MGSSLTEIRSCITCTSFLPNKPKPGRWSGVSKEQFYNPKLFELMPMGFCYPGKGVSGDLPPRLDVPHFGTINFFLRIAEDREPGL